MLFNPFGGYLIQTYGWRITYLVFGAIILLLILVRLGTKLTERFAPDRLRRMFRLVGAVLLALGLFGFLQ